MIVVRNLQSTHQIQNPAIRALVQQRIQGLLEQGLSIDEVGHFIVVDASDTVATMEQQLGVSISSHELIEEIPNCCFDVVYVLDQSGKGIEAFIPTTEAGLDPDLLAMCLQHAFKEDTQ